ncbi:MAG: homoprotocatechuate degradation operon regulator HpaR [Pseudomonadota bacterium]
MARTTKTSTAEQEVHLRPLAQSLPMTLLRAREACMAEFRPMLHEHKLTEQQWRVLRVLMENDEITVTKLAREAVILPPSLSRILRGLISKGLVKKRAQRIDQRRAQVMMTAKGQRLYRAVAPHSSEIYRQLEKRLGKQRLEELNSMLQDIENDLADS